MKKVQHKHRHQSPSAIKKQAGTTLKPRLFLQSPYLWLVIVPLVLYAKIVFFDFTALDDQFFVIDHAGFNQHLGNIFSAFSQGLFVPKNDSYYRPVFLIDMIIENHLFGVSPWGYHLMSLLFHIASVCLLYLFLHRIKLGETPALVLALVFAVHPVLTQTVAWIPGRNDLILMIFFLATLIFATGYYQGSKLYLFAAQFATFLLALFTKETAVIIPVITLLVLRYACGVRYAKMVPMFVSWLVALLIWYALRASSEPSYQGLLFREMVHSGIARIPAILQYLGKIFFPVNLAAVPRFEDITLLWGSVAAVFLAALVIVSKSYKKPLAIIGALWFLLFLLPVLTVPKQLNDQVYEHRLYLPIIGILLVLSQTILFSEKWKRKNILMVSSGVLVIFFITSFIRLDCYHDRHIFWDRAVADAPTSAFAKLNQGIQAKDSLLRERYIRQAYALSRSEMLVNYWMGIMAERNGKTDSAVWFYRNELAYSNFPDLYFNLSGCLFKLNRLDSAAFYLSKGVNLDPTKTKAVKVLAEVYFKLAESAYGRRKFDSAACYLRQVTQFDPKNEQASHNLAMVLFQTGRRPEALRVVENMRLNDIPVSRDLAELSK